MDAERWREIDRLLDAALDRPPRERQPFLAAACGGDAALLHAVERLLAADAAAPTYLEQPAGLLASFFPDGDEEDFVPGKRLGPYSLIRALSRGGMGTVYLASRDDGQYETRVAVKILHRGLATTELGRRFRAERQILARLEHPHIARLHDGGTTDDGRPYLVMDYVEGLPIDQYCDLHRLGIEARLDLFRRVCGAVQHAHQNLLVHRDLKPANILVTAAGEPKLLDFGIAKRLDPVAASQTRTGLRAMTPGYASPEQVRGEAVSTVSDVYSLGVILYELLTGRSPYRSETGSPHELERAVCEQEPERPSVAVDRDAAQARGLPLRDLRRRLRGDLDAIVLTALRKEPWRRYGSADQLAQDLERHRTFRPVKAQGDSWAYRSGRLVRRHRWFAALAGLATVLVLALLAVLFLQVERTARERDKARYALAFLVDVFRTSDPYQTGGERVSVQEILARGASRIRSELAGQPEVQAALMDAMGQTYLGLGRSDQAKPLLERALELRKDAGAGLDVAFATGHLADLRRAEGDYSAALGLYQESLDRKRDLLGDDHPEIARSLNRLGDLLVEMNRGEDAQAFHEQALDIHRRRGEAGREGVAETLVLLGRLEQRQGRYARAEALLRQALDLQRQGLGPRHPKVASTLSALALIRLDLDDRKDAENLFQQALSLQRESLEPGHPDLVRTLNDLALAVHHQGRLNDAEALYREALQMYRARLGDHHPLVADALNNVGSVVQALGEGDEAARLHEEALAIRRRVFGERHQSVAQSLLQISRSHWAAGRLDLAEGYARRSLETLRTVLGPRNPLVAYPLTDLGRILTEQKRLVEAEAFLRESLAIRRETLPGQHFEIARVGADLAECLTLQGRYEEAETLLLEARASLTAQFPPGDKRVTDTSRRLAELYRAWGREGEAKKYGEAGGSERSKA